MQFFTNAALALAFGMVSVSALDFNMLNKVEDKSSSASATSSAASESSTASSTADPEVSGEESQVTLEAHD